MQLQKGDHSQFQAELVLQRKTEVESLRTSSRTHFEVPGLGLEGQVLGLEASNP